MSEKSGLIIGRYNLLKDAPRIGGMSYVRKARDLETDEEVAVKFLEDQPYEGLLKKIFEREVRGLQSLNHKNIIKYIDSGYSAEGRPFIVTEWIELSLLDVLRQYPDGAMQLGEVLTQIGVPLAEALAYAHSLHPHPIEHRDLKVGNILMRNGREPVLIDFGIGKNIDEPVGDGVTSIDFKSMPYAPPWDAPQNFLRDVYSFGVVILRCLAGEKLKNIEDIEPALTQLGPNSQGFLRQCVNLSPGKIFSSGVELNSELKKLASGFQGIKGAQVQALELVLTNTAKEHVKNDLDGRPTDSDVVRKLNEELETGFHIEYALKDDLKSLNFEKVKIATNERILVCVLDEYDSYMTVISASIQEYHVLDSLRNRAVEIGLELPIEFSPVINKSKCKKGFAFLLQRLEESIKVDEATSAKANDGQNFLDRLEKSLTVREKVVNQSSRMLSVDSCVYKGNVIEVQVSANEAENSFALLDSELEIIANDTRTVIAQGEIVAQSGGEIAITPIGRVLNLRDAAFVRTSQYASRNSLRRQRDALEVVRTKEIRNPRLSDVLVDPKSSKFTNKTLITSWNLDLDDDKKAAVQMVMDSEDFCLVQGPPGTGKTQLISEVVHQTLLRKPDARILLVSQTHVAVDNAVERIAKSGLQSMVRIAKSDKQILSSVEPFRLRNRAGVWRDKVRQSAQKFIEEKLNQFGFDEKSFLASQVIGELLAALDSKERLLREHNRIQSQSNEYTSLTLGKEELSSETEINESLSTVNIRQTELVLKLNSVKPSWLNLNNDSDVINSTNQLMAIQNALLPKDAYTSNLSELVQLQSEWIERLTTDDSILENFLVSRNLLAGTAIGFLGEKHIANLEFDLCIIDEASKATANELLVPISKSKKVLLVGDSRQLPPMSEVHNQESLLNDVGISKQEFEETLFEYMEESLGSESVRSLSNQYRMVSGIGDLISSVFYEGKLKSRNNKKLNEMDSYCKPVTWLDTSKMEAHETQVSGSYSLQNPVEVQIIQREIEQFQMHLTKLNSSMILETIVIAPYAAQVNALNKALRRIETPNLTIECLTIDQVQGRESDIAFVSLVRSNDFGRLGFLSERRRLNVAFSRARYGLQIVGNADFLRKSPTKLQAVISYIESNQTTCEIKVLENA